MHVSIGWHPGMSYHAHRARYLVDQAVRVGVRGSYWISRVWIERADGGDVPSRTKPPESPGVPRAELAREQAASAARATNAAVAAYQRHRPAFLTLVLTCD
jgi:hypothetical protein